jgi:flavin reductase (DIM6/NTAB) family NADH-FMN oxidoreductase RutF
MQREDRSRTLDTMQGLDPRAFRNALGHFASGITIISGSDAEGPIGFTCQSFYSVSMDPPLISFSVMINSTTYELAGLFRFKSHLTAISADQRPFCGR